LTRGIDHLVLCVNDLDQARDLYQRIGFTLTPKAQHPFGTGNCLAQFDNSFLELLTVTRPELISEHDGDNFSFGAYNRGYLQNRQGMSMLAMTSTNWKTDRDEFAAKGLKINAPFSFSRTAQQPDGGEVKVGFDLTFVDPDPEQDLQEAWFTCSHQHPPEYFWKPEYQTHDNGVETIKAVYLVNDDVTEKLEFVDRLDLDPEQGEVQVLSHSDFESLFPGQGVERDYNGFCGYSLIVHDLPHMREVLSRGNIDFQSDAERIWIDKPGALGVVIEFVEKDQRQ